MWSWCWSPAEGQQKPKLSPSTAGLWLSRTAGNYSLPNFSLTGRWRHISLRLSVPGCLPHFAGILPSSLLWDRLFVLSVSAMLLPSKAHSNKQQLCLSFGGVFPVWAFQGVRKGCCQRISYSSSKTKRGTAGAWWTVFLLGCFQTPQKAHDLLSVWSVEQIWMGRAIFVTLLLSPLIPQAQQWRPPNTGDNLAHSPAGLHPSPAGEAFQAHGTSHGAGHTFLHAAGKSQVGTSLLPAP